MNLTSIAGGLVGAVLVYAGVAKTLTTRQWVASARRLGIPAVLAVVVMIAEVVIGLGVVLGDTWRSEFLIAAAVLIASFTAVLASHLRNDDRPPCACFGGAGHRPIGARDIVRNVALLVLVLVAFTS